MDPDNTAVLHIKKTSGVEYQHPEPEAPSINSSEINWPLDEDSSRVCRMEHCQPASLANETQEERYARETASRAGVNIGLECCCVWLEVYPSSLSVREGKSTDFQRIHRTRFHTHHYALLPGPLHHPYLSSFPAVTRPNDAHS